MRKRLGEAGLPNLWVPAADGFVEIDALPVLGTGKLDLKALGLLAQEKMAGRGSATADEPETAETAA